MVVEYVTQMDFFETVVPADSRSFCSPPQVVLGSCTTLLIILVTPLPEILRAAPGCSQFMVDALGLWSQQCPLEPSVVLL